MFYEFFSEKNTPYFVVIFGILLVVLIVGLFVKQFLFERKISTKTINIVSRIETDATTGAESVKMTIANNGFHSVEIRGFGFKHKNRDYDYLRTYKEERNIPYNQKIVISPRDSLENVIDLNELKAKLNTKKIGKFRAYVIDVYGNYCLLKAKDVKKFIELYFKHVEYIEKVKAMPAEKQAKKLAKEKAYEERRKKILNNTIEDSFEKANIETSEDTKKFQEDLKAFKKETETVNDVVAEENVQEEVIEDEATEVNEVIEEENKNEDDFVFGNFNYDDEGKKDSEE